MGTGLSGTDSAVAHRVQFYESDDEIIERLTSFAVDGMREGAAVVIATATHRRMLERALSARGLDPGQMQQSGRLTVLDAVDTLRRFYQHGVLDPDAFTTVIGGLIDSATSRGLRV